MKYKESGHILIVFAFFIFVVLIAAPVYGTSCEKEYSDFLEAKEEYGKALTGGTGNENINYLQERQKAAYNRYIKCIDDSGSSATSQPTTTPPTSTPFPPSTSTPAQGIGTLYITSTPTFARIWIDGWPTGWLTPMEIQKEPSTYTITLMEDGYEDYTQTVTVTAGKQVDVIATLSPTSSESDVIPIAAAAGGVLVAGYGATVVIGKILAGMKGATGGTPSPPPPSSGPSSELYGEWLKRTKPEERGIDSLEDFLTSRLGSQKLSSYQDEYGRPSWASSYYSWKAEVEKGGISSSFEDWIGHEGAGERSLREARQKWDGTPKARRRDLVEMDKRLAGHKLNKERWEKFEQLKEAVAKDEDLLDFVNRVQGDVVDGKGRVNKEKLELMESVLKRRIYRDKMAPQMEDYAYSDAFYDTVTQASNNVVIRVGAAVVSGGSSEMALIPVSATMTMRGSIMADESTVVAVAKGFGQATLDLAVGEVMDRKVIKVFSPSVKSGMKVLHRSKLGRTLLGTPHDAERIGTALVKESMGAGFIETIKGVYNWMRK